MRFLSSTIVVAAVVCLLGGCKKESVKQGAKEHGTLNLLITENAAVTGMEVASFQSKANPVVGNFTLDILQKTTLVQKVSPIGSGNQSISLEQGNYTLLVYSDEFTVPAFDKPVYGATTDVQIVAKQTTNTSMECLQTNCGVKIVYDPNFTTNHTNYSAKVSQTAGSLLFSGVDATRTGYFLPGNANLVVTADGVEYTQALSLLPHKLYTVTVRDEVSNISGGLSLSITVNVECVNEDIEVVFPDNGGGSSGGNGEGDGESAAENYAENMGDVPVSSQISASVFTSWQNKKATYAASNVMVVCENASDYPNASAGNYLMLAKNSTFTISGVNTNGALSPTLSFGCCNAVGNFVLSNLVVSVSTDGVNFTPLTYSRSLNSRWAEVLVTSGIPKSENLYVKFQCTATSYYLIDDVKITSQP